MAPAQERRLAEGIGKVFDRHNRRQEFHARLTKAVLDAKARLVLLAFREAWQLGYTVHRVENFRREHCMRVFDSWRERGISRDTAARRWRAVKLFADGIGKPAMLPALVELWPVSESEAHPQEKSVVQRVGVPDFSEGEYHQLLDRLGESNPVFWVLRLERELGICREEALMTNLVVAVSRASSVLPVSKTGGQRARVVSVENEQQRELLVGARRFVEQRGRERLCWIGVPAEKALRRVNNAVFYQRQRLSGSKA
jgi:hypothetical protein